MPQFRQIGKIGDIGIDQISLQGSNGLRVELLSYGARLAELWAPDRNGHLADVILGQESLEDWQSIGTYLGATCGRYANRIAGGRFDLDGQVRQLSQNEGSTTLHGGGVGFDRKVWEIERLTDTQVTFSTTSPDGDMGFPGKLKARVSYELDGHCLMIEMTAETDAPTVVNLVNHAYFNLAGQESGSIMGQLLQVDAAHYLPVDQTLIPTGEVRSVTGTAFDFRKTRTIGELLPSPDGFDHNLCLSAPIESNGLRPCLVAIDPASGRRLRLATTEPGVQLYTGAHFDGGPGKRGARYPRFAGFAAETQRFPDSPNNPQFPSARLDPGQTYRHRMQLDLTPLAPDEVRE